MRISSLVRGPSLTGGFALCGRRMVVNSLLLPLSCEIETWGSCSRRATVSGFADRGCNAPWCRVVAEIVRNRRFLHTPAAPLPRFICKIMRKCALLTCCMPAVARLKRSHSIRAGGRNAHTFLPRRNQAPSGFPHSEIWQIAHLRRRCRRRKAKECDHGQAIHHGR